MSIRFEVSDVIRTSPERIFDALLDLERAGEWMPGLVRVEPLSPGALRVGSEWRETRKVFGKEATEQFRLDAVDRPSRIDLSVDGSKGTSGRGEYVFTYRLDPIAVGSKVHLSGEIRGLSGVPALLGRLFISAYRKSCARDLTALKAYLETERAETPAAGDGPAGQP